ncbi:response regulator [Pseudomonas asuensis]
MINARDAMPNGGTIDISTSSIHLNEDHGPEMDGLKAGDYIKLSIKDTGTGMTPDVQAKVFDPFFTTKPIGQGTGLGLSMVYGYIKQSKGHIRIISEPGKGTEVCLYLPCHKGAIDEAPIGTDTAISLGSGETVLVVEDEAVVRGLVIEVLKELGYEVLEAADSKSAIPILESHQRIDLMISDVGLPGLNGRQLAEIARQFRPELKVLFATGYAEGSYVKGYLGRGMALITKPFAIDTLAARIKEMLAAEF